MPDLKLVMAGLDPAIFFLRCYVRFAGQARE